LTPSPADFQAQRRALDWQMGWFAEPIFKAKGDYPSNMRQRCGERLPTFTEEELDYVRGSSDFFGLNHYSSDYVRAPDGRGSMPFQGNTRRSGGYFDDMEVDNVSDPAWPKTDMGWDIVPWGLRRVVNCIHKEYAPPEGILVTENGCAV